MDTLGKRLKYARHRAEISQETLADRAKTSKAGVSKLEAEITQNCALETLFNFADVLGVDPRWLATGKASPPDPSIKLRFDVNKALAKLPKDLQEPILTLVENAAKAAEQRFWEWAREQEK